MDFFMPGRSTLSLVTEPLNPLCVRGNTQYREHATESASMMDSRTYDSKQNLLKILFNFLRAHFHEVKLTGNHVLDAQFFRILNRFDGLIIGFSIQDRDFNEKIRAFDFVVSAETFQFSEYGIIDFHFN